MDGVGGRTRIEREGIGEERTRESDFGGEGADVQREREREQKGRRKETSRGYRRDEGGRGGRRADGRCASRSSVTRKRLLAVQ